MLLPISLAGNRPQKYWLPKVPLYPLELASVVISWSIPGFLCSHRSEIPLCCSVHLPHQAMSFLASEGMVYCCFLSIPLIH